MKNPGLRIVQHNNGISLCGQLSPNYKEIWGNEIVFHLRSNQFRIATSVDFKTYKVTSTGKFCFGIADIELRESLIGEYTLEQDNDFYIMNKRS